MDARFHAPRKAEVLAAQSRFVLAVTVCAAVLVVIHCLPKTRFTPAPMRLVYTVIYFGALMILLIQFLKPLKSYLQLLFGWRYAEAPELIQRAAKSVLFSLCQLIGVPVSLLLAFLSSVALITLGLWFPDMNVLAPFFNFVWWVSLVGLLLFPFVGGFLFTETMLKNRQLVHEIELSRWFVPRSFSDLQSPEKSDAPEPLEICEGRKFRAAGFDWEWNDFVQNCMVFGQIGSGKTSCVMNTLLDGLIGSAAQTDQHTSALILDPKGTYLEDIRTLCLKYRRSTDLLVLNPNDPESMHWNPFDSSDDEYELATRFSAVSRSLGARDTTSSFWQTKSTMFIQYALELIRLTNPPNEPPSFAGIYELVSSFTAIHERATMLDLADPRCHGCLSFFATEWANIAPETRTSIQAHLTGLLFPFLKEPYATKFAGRSTMRLSDILDNGKLIYLHMPTADRETMARTIGVFLKLEFYREVLRRPRKKRPSLFFCDEFHKFFTAGSKDDKEQEKSDADAFRLTRESFHANVVATQNLGALGEDEVARAFLANCMTNVFLRNPDGPTNQFASELFGEEYMASMSVSQGRRAGRLPGLGNGNISSSDSSESRCPPDRFRELAIRSAGQAVPHCESIVFLGSRGESPIPIRRLKWKAHPISMS